MKLGQTSCLVIALSLAASFQVVGFFVLDPITFDSREYLALSESLFQGGGYAAPAGLNGFSEFVGEAPTRMRQPGYPLFLDLVYWHCGKSLWTVRGIQMALNLLVLALMVHIAAPLVGPQTRRAATLLLGVYFPWLWTSATVLTETLFTFFLGLTVFAISKALQSPRRWGWTVMGGALLGCLTLIRPIGLVVALFSVLPFTARLGPGQGLRAWSLLLTTLLLVLAPWIVRNSVSLGDLTPISSEAGYNLWVSTLRKEDPIWNTHPEFAQATEGAYYIDRVADVRFRRIARASIGEDPLGYFERGCERTVKTLTRFPGTGRLEAPQLRRVLAWLQGALLLAALVGFFSLKNRDRWLLAFPGLAVVAVSPLALPVTRYVLPVMPFLLVLAAQGMGRILLRLKPVGRLG